MPDAPMGSVVFLKAYTDLAGVEPVRPIIKGSLASAVSKYIASSHFTTMAPLTQGVRRRALERIRETAGSQKALTSDVIRADLKYCDGPAQQTQLKMWRRFCKYLLHIRVIDFIVIISILVISNQAAEEFISAKFGIMYFLQISDLIQMNSIHSLYCPIRRFLFV